MTKIQIKNIENAILFEFEKEENTIKDTLIEGIKQGIDFNNANLSGIDLRGAVLSGAKSVPYIPLVCPSDGEFIGWKKVKSCLIKLKIPFDAKRSSATSQKCRCDKAMVLEIIDLGDNEPIEEIMNDSQDVPLLYRVGEMVYPDSFDENRWNECSHGIHFFINKEEAIRY